MGIFGEFLGEKRGVKREKQEETGSASQKKGKKSEDF